MYQFLNQIFFSINIDNSNSAPNSNNSSTSNPNYNQMQGGFVPGGPNNHPQYIYQGSAPTMSTSSTSSQTSHFSYQGGPPPQYAPHHPGPGPNIRMVIPGNQQFYPPGGDQHHPNHPQVFYPYNSQMPHQAPPPPHGYQQQPQQSMPQPPPSSTPSNIINQNQSAPHTPSPMPSQANVFIPPNNAQQANNNSANGNNNGNPQQAPNSNQIPPPPNAQGMVYQPPHMPPYYMQAPGPGFPGYMPQSPAGASQMPPHQQPGFQGYPVYRKFFLLTGHSFLRL